MKQSKVCDKSFKRIQSITYTSIFVAINDTFNKFKRDLPFNILAEGAEDFEICESGCWWEGYEITRMMEFLAVAYCEIIHAGELTEQFKYEMFLDVPIWDSGEVEKFLFEEEKNLVFHHLKVVKKYMEKINIKAEDFVNMTRIY